VAVLDHVKLTVSDLERSKKFYEQALAPLGYQVASEGEGFVGLGAGDHAIPDLWLGLGDVTSSTHVALRADRAGVDSFHEAAVGAGGEDNGSPGIRAHYHENYYGAFVRDPDGHNIEAVCHTTEAES
jgi:catechol 2,3-dioxygenase-like lactoylglutathione lyase family enzyme